MADAATIQEFLVTLGYKIDEGSQQRFQKGLDNAGKAAKNVGAATDTLGKHVTKVGSVFAGLAGEPMRKFYDFGHKALQTITQVGKSSVELGKTAMGVGVAFAGAMSVIARQYEGLYYMSKQVGGSAADLMAGQAAFGAVNDSAKDLDAALVSINSTLREFPSHGALLNSLLGADWKTIKDQPQGVINLLDNLNKMVKEGGGASTLAYQYAGMFGLRGLLNQWDALGPAVKAAAKVAAQQQRDMAKDHEDFAKRYLEASADITTKEKQTWDAVGTIQQQVFLESYPAMRNFWLRLQGFLGWVAQWNRDHPGMAMKEGLASLIAGWGILSGPTGILAKVGLGFMSLTPLTAAFAAAAGIIIENWEPVSKFFDKHFAKIREDFNKGDWKSVGKDIGETIKDAFTGIGGYIKTEFEGIKWKELGQTAVGVFQAAWEAGLYLFDWMATEIKTIDWAGIGKSASDLFQQAWQGAKSLGIWMRDQFNNIDWNAVGNEIAGDIKLAFQSAWAVGQWISAQFHNIPWNEIGTQAADEIKRAWQATLAVGTWLSDQLKSVKWDAVGNDIAGAIKGAWQDTLAVGQWLKDEFNSVKWNEVGTSAGNAFKAGWQSLVQAGIWVRDQLNNVDWNATGGEIGGALKFGITALLDFGKWISDQIKAVDWPTVFSLIGDAILGVLHRALDISDWLRTSVDWNKLGEQIGRDIADAIKWLFQDDKTGEEWRGAVIHAFAGIAKDAIIIGVDIVGGIVKGIWQGLGGEAFTNAVAAIRQSVRKAFGMSEDGGGAPGRPELPRFTPQAAQPDPDWKRRLFGSKKTGSKGVWPFNLGGPMDENKPDSTSPGTVPGTPPEPAAPQVAGPPALHYQQGGIVKINAHEGEMVLPAPISRGLQWMISHFRIGKQAEQETEQRTNSQMMQQIGTILPQVAEQLMFAAMGLRGAQFAYTGGRAAHAAGPEQLKEDPQRQRDIWNRIFKGTPLEDKTKGAGSWLAQEVTGDQRTGMQRLLDWLQGTIVPKVKVDNTDDFKEGAGAAAGGAGAPAAAGGAPGAVGGGAAAGGAPGAAGGGAAAGGAPGAAAGASAGGGGGRGGTPAAAGGGPPEAVSQIGNLGKGFATRAAPLVSKLGSDLNLTPAQAAGLLGNLGYESRGLTSGIQEGHPISGKGGLGWAQWTGSRRDAFEKWAAENKLDVHSDAANYGFLVHELKGKEWQPFLQNLRQAKDTQQATDIVLRQYEKPKDPAASEAQRQQMAQQALAASQRPAVVAGVGPGYPTRALQVGETGRAPGAAGPAPTLVPPARAAPASMAAAAPPSQPAAGFQRGGIVPINAHAGEMVLPEHLSRGFQNMLRQGAMFDRIAGTRVGESRGSLTNIANNSGGNRGPYNVNIHNHTSVQGFPGENAGQVAFRYAGAQRRVYADMHRDLKANLT